MFEKEMDPEGPFFFGTELSWVDILIAPCKHIKGQTISIQQSLRPYSRGNPFRTCPQALSRVLAVIGI